MRVFWSYARRDDPKPFNLSKLREQFQIILGQCKGKDIDVFQDKTGLKWGAKWRETLETEVVSSNAFVCILTPSYFSSKMCIQEFSWALENNVGIYPILYRKCPEGFKSNFTGKKDKLNKILNRASERIGDYQYRDFTLIRNLERTSSEVQEFLDAVCEEIA